MPTARQVSAQQRRTAIADAVIALLADGGGRSATHRNVDRLLGLPEGSTSAYFRTRASLLVAATHRLADLDRASIADLLARPELVTPAQLVAAVVADWTSPAAASGQVARVELQLEARRDPDLAEVLAGERSRFVDLVRDRLAEIPDGIGDVALLAQTIPALVDGLVLDRLLHPRTAPPRASLTAMADSLVAGWIS